MKLLIIGGVAGGAAAAARARRLNEDAEIIMFERGEYISFANCGLPYYIGGEIKERSALVLQTKDSFKAKLNVDVRLLSEVISIDREKKTVKVKNHAENKTYEESYDKLLISTGAEPVKPPIKGIESGRVFTLRTIPDTDKIKEYIVNKNPKSAVVIGGGYIGIEMAENLFSAGLDVTIVEMADHIIAPLDYDMACEAHNHIRSKGVKLILKNGVKSIEEKEDSLTVNLNEGNVNADMVIMAVGVRPESKLAKDCGLEVSPRGSIVVGEGMLTSDQDIYAVGDAVQIKDYITENPGFIPLAGPAAKQGRVAADNIMGGKSVYTGTQGTAILKCFDMTVACTGINETVAKVNKFDYETAIIFSASHATYYPGSFTMCIKLVFEKKTGKVLGAQITGFEGVDKRIDVLATAIRAKMTVFDLAKLELAYAPPYSSAKDPVNMIGFVAENIITGRVKVFHHYDIDGLDKAKINLIDVRTPQEYEMGHYEGIKNIPLAEIRERAGEIDKNKPVYLVCSTGLMSYMAYNVLKAKGYDCYNLTGGYRMYKSVNNKEEVRPVVKTNTENEVVTSATVVLDACGLQCPGPIMKLSKAVKEAKDGDVIEIKTTDPAFCSDVEGWCKRTNNTFIGISSEKGVTTAKIVKGFGEKVRDEVTKAAACDGKNIIVFSGDLDKAIASFIIANAAASMNRKVSMFFTFWGLNILRRPEKVKIKKDFMSKMFGMMMPRGSSKLGLSKMNMGGMGAKMIRGIMKKKNVESLEDLIRLSMENGVELVACSMSMDVMGIKQEELIDGVKIGGAAAMLAHAEESDMSLFI